MTSSLLSPEIRDLTLRISAALMLVMTFCVLRPAYAEVHSFAGSSYEKSHVVKPGKLLEVCADVAANSVVNWKYTSTADVEFNIHRHEGVNGKKVVFDVDNVRARERDGVLKQAKAHEWCWMWTNKSATDATIQIQLSRD